MACMLVLRASKGELEAVVIATGVHTFFGKAAHLVASTNQVFAKGVDADTVVLMATRASRTENQEAIHCYSWHVLVFKNFTSFHSTN